VNELYGKDYKEGDDIRDFRGSDYNRMSKEMGYLIFNFVFLIKKLF